MQKIYLDLDELKFYCPATGQRVFSMEEPYELSPATKFVYLFEAREFDFITPEL